jgi:ornithine lipid ester-linked acyl 2-hydroxylase
MVTQAGEADSLDAPRRRWTRPNREWVIAFGLKLLPLIDRFLVRFSTIPNQPILPNTLFPWTAELEGNWQLVQAEAESLLRDRMSVPSVREISADHEKIAVDEKWRSFFFWAYGIRADANCDRCPQTAQLLDKIPGLLSAFYSVMLAGAHVPQHAGPTKAILTAHMGLIIPLKRQDCHMQVADQNVVWEKGRLVIFDDMYPHEVWNRTDEDRIILLVHVKRPLRFPGSLIRDGLFALLRASPFVKDGVRNVERWEKARHADL